MSAQAGGFGQKFLSGSLWIMLRLLGRQAIQSLAFFAFAYFMDPASFGLASMATSLGFLGRLVVERGARDRVIQREEHDAGTLSTAFWLALALGAGMTVLLGIIGTVIVRSTADLSGVSLFLAAACVPLLVAPSRVQEGLLRRDFGFRRLAGLQMVVSILALGVSMIILKMGAGPWAVVIFVLAEALFLSVALWIATPFRPDFLFDAEEAREQLRFSGAVIVGAVLTVGNLRIIEIGLGVLLGPAAAGFFRLGVQVNRLLTQMLRTPVNNMVLPSFARLSDPAAIAGRMLDVSAISALVTLPAFALAAAGSPDLFELVMGQEWRPAGVAALWICLGIYAQMLPPIVNPVLISTGRPFEATRLAMVVFAASFAFTMAGGTAYDLTGATIGLAAVVTVVLPYTIWLMLRHFQLELSAILRALAVSFVASLATFGLVAGLLAIGGEAPSASRLVLALAAGVVFYLGLALLGTWTFDKPRFSRLRQSAAKLSPRGGKTAE